MVQTIVITSDKQLHTLRGFFYQWRKYAMHLGRVTVCGFEQLVDYNLGYDPERIVLGKESDYPIHNWSDALIKILDEVADNVFILMLDDYWLTRQLDVQGIHIIYDYMHQFQNVIKFDLCSDRLNADPGRYAYNNSTYDTAGYLDLIKSDYQSAYHLSLWGGMWRKDLLRRFLVPNETAQQIELNGTRRLAQAGDELLVLGTRQSPMKHANVIQGGKWNQDPNVGLPALSKADRDELKGHGYV